MEKTKEYERAKFEIIYLNSTDVIATSQVGSFGAPVIDYNAWDSQSGGQWS